MMIDPIHYILHHTLVSFQETTHDILIIIRMYQNLRPTEDWILRNLFRREEYRIHNKAIHMVLHAIISQALFHQLSAG